MLAYEKIASEIVESGANVLDVAIGPEWIERMPEDETLIDFMDSFRCPLQYAFGDFLMGDRVLASKGYYSLGEYGFACPTAFKNFNVVDLQDAYAEVNAMWHELIRTRRAES